MNLAIMVSVCHELCQSPAYGSPAKHDLAELTESARECSHRGLQPTKKDELAWPDSRPIPAKPYCDPDWHADDIEAIFNRSWIPGLAADVQRLEEPRHAITRRDMIGQVSPADLTPPAGRCLGIYSRAAKIKG